MKILNNWRVLVAASLLLLVSACAPSARSLGLAGAAGDGPGNLRMAQQGVVEAVRNLPKSRIGNADEYTVFGQRYQVMDSAVGFAETGTASWYGAKFHGRNTSSGEVYDMHLMTAAHKNLPLPTFVRVTRMDNGQSIVVKVNDRGPFVDDRVIDLSYAAAQQLDMLGSGTARVQIEAVSSHLTEVSVVKSGLVPNEPVAGNEPLAVDALQESDESSVTTHLSAPHGVMPAAFLQLGAFSENSNATSLLSRVEPMVSQPVGIVRDAASALWRVHVGPIQDQDSLDSTLAVLASAGIASYTLVSSE
ncbi:MAG: septal ring lytic transglycosylase RlpA family protein [Granulosicoccus sp.]